MQPKLDDLYNTEIGQNLAFRLGMSIILTHPSTFWKACTAVEKLWTRCHPSATGQEVVGKNPVGHSTTLERFVSCGNLPWILGWR